jgi:hypothetical protein
MKIVNHSKTNSSLRFKIDYVGRFDTNFDHPLLKYYYYYNFVYYIIYLNVDLNFIIFLQIF